MPSTVHAATDGNGDLVLLNQVTGHWHKLNRTGTDFFHALSSSVDLDEAVNVLADRHPHIPAERIRHDVEQLVRALVARGLLVLAEDLKRSAAAVLMTAQKPTGRITSGQRAAALVAFLIALVLLRLPFRIATNTVIRLRKTLAHKDATVPEAESALSAAHRITRAYPGRVACLELSLTAVLTAALQRHRVDWCFGTAVDPQTFHAWIEVRGEPVTDPLDAPIPPTYRKVLTV
ncbi:lasso peptide biosynthesis B2 protein [Actinocrispum wychmicini]|uniref:Coenzyme PQQ synthesis protein D (PqqD) n=1 Tax=Actinocrispum wychmicini TaxID=1213861 RepID=A0A4R2JMT0_9PSEU|nr:lasso peptide biosynthesis B2 protein [Actinocrispum wychmicini]TCO57959.1 coenzyme PQQ synthesis protein D (PqqD) [Actinocrispum wychmicini]